MTRAERLVTGRAAVRGFGWSISAHIGTRVILLAGTMVLTRILDPEDFGVAAYAFTLVGCLRVFQGLGLGPAMIYLEDSRESRDTAFWLAVVIGLSLAAAIYVGAPLAAWFFRDPRAAPIVRILALQLPISSLALVHEFVLRKNLAFGRATSPEYIRAIGKVGVSISLAVLGAGAFSLIYGQLVGAFLVTVMFWILLPWRPRLVFSVAQARLLTTFGSKIVAASTVEAVIRYADHLLVGRFLGASALGVYAIGFRLPELVVSQTSVVAARVIYPILSFVGGDRQTRLRHFSAALRYMALAALPAGVGLALVAGPVVLLAFGEEWKQAAAVTRPLALAVMIRALALPSGSLFRAQGRPELSVYLGIVEALVFLPGLLWAITSYGTIQAVAWVHVVAALVSFCLHSLVTVRVCGCDWRVLFRAVASPTAATLAMSIAVLGTLMASRELLRALQLAAAVAAGVVTYLSILWVMHPRLLAEAAAKIRSGLARGPVRNGSDSEDSESDSQDAGTTPR